MRKVTVSLPVALLEWLDSKVEGRKRSAFIAEAIAEKLNLVEQAEAIEASAGAWKDEDYPHMATEEDIDRWLAELRGGSLPPAAKKVAESGTEYKTS
jgi:Arc/MetJ-type ribon-helix-helix transcriptional regulator